MPTRHALLGATWSRVPITWRMKRLAKAFEEQISGQSGTGVFLVNTKIQARISNGSVLAQDNKQRIVTKQYLMTMSITRLGIRPSDAHSRTRIAPAKSG